MTSEQSEEAPVNRPECPQRMQWVPDPNGPVELGVSKERSGGYDGTVMPIARRTIVHEAGGFCIDEAHFPGRGYPWPNARGGGSSRALAEAFRDGLPNLNRRLCTYSEKLYATAGPDNWDFGHHPTDGGAVDCEFETRVRDNRSPKHPIGMWANCKTNHSSWTLWDIDARATWVTRDSESIAAMKGWWQGGLDTDPGAPMLNTSLSGWSLQPGNSNFFPTVAGYHCHGDRTNDCGGNQEDTRTTRYFDDGFVFCADPHELVPKTEERYARAREAVAKSGLYDSLLPFLEEKTP